MTSVAERPSSAAFPVSPTHECGGDADDLSDGPFTTIGYEEFTPTASSIGAVREAVARMLAPYDVDSRQVFACQLIADELATNALLHARSYFSLAIAISPRSVRIAVRDESRSYPVLTVPSSDALAGRGLSIVSETATRWGSESLGRGKETWADYAVDVDVEP